MRRGLDSKLVLVEKRVAFIRGKALALHPFSEDQSYKEGTEIGYVTLGQLQLVSWHTYWPCQLATNQGAEQEQKQAEKERRIAVAASPHCGKQLTSKLDWSWPHSCCSMETAFSLDQASWTPWRCLYLLEDLLAIHLRLLCQFWVSKEQWFQRSFMPSLPSPPCTQSLGSIYTQWGEESGTCLGEPAVQFHILLMNTFYLFFFSFWVISFLILIVIPTLPYLPYKNI